MTEERKHTPFIISMTNEAIYIDQDKATKDAYAAFLDECINSTSLVFNLRYTVSGVPREIKGRDIAGAREKNPFERGSYIEELATELTHAEGLQVLMGTADAPDTRNLY